MIVYLNWDREVQTINQHYYLEILAQAEFWKNKSWVLHHENVPAPITNADVKRLFSIFKHALSDKRQSFKIENWKNI
jgi:hypothetical protein